MDVTLTPGGISDLSRGDTQSRPIVQVLDIIKSQNLKRNRFLVSDSVSTLQAVLDDDLDDMITKGDVREGSVVHLIEYLSNSKKVYIMNMQAVIPECQKIGDPKPLGRPHLTCQSASSSDNVSAPTGNGNNTPVFTEKPAYQPPTPANSEVSTQITSISGLSPNYLGEWILKARVTRLGALLYHNGVTKYFSFDLLDSDGGEIHVRCVGNTAVAQFYPHVEVGKVYLVSRGSLRHVPNEHNHLRNENECEIILKETSMLEKCEEDSSIPQQKFLFTPISEIKNAEDRSILDVIGIVTNVTPPVLIRCRNGTKRVRRKLDLKDETSEGVEITLWGGFCDDEGHVLREMLDAGVSPVLAVKASRINVVNGKLLVDTVSFSQLFYNPDLRETGRLRSWFDSGAEIRELSKGGEKKVVSFSWIFTTPDVHAADEWRTKFDSGAKKAAALGIARDFSRREKKKKKHSYLPPYNPVGFENYADLMSAELLRNLDFPAPAKSTILFGSIAKNAAALSNCEKEVFGSSSCQ